MKYIVVCVEEGDSREVLVRLPLKDVAETAVVEGRVVKGTVKEQVQRVMREIGIPSNLKGKDLLIDAVVKTLEEDRILSATKELYPFLAKQHNDTPSTVERAMRHAIERGFDYSSPAVIEKIFGNSINPVKGKPTNSEFVNGVAEYIKSQV